MVIFWIYVSSCLYQATEIKDYQAAYDISKPLDSLPLAKRNAVLAAVCRKIEAMARPVGAPEVGAAPALEGQPVLKAFQPSDVRQQLSDAAVEYERVRSTTPSGDERTKQMEASVAKVRTLAIAGYPLLKEFSESSWPGERLLAIVMLQVRTNPDYIRWLGARISAERAFIGYHAALALLAAARVLDATHYATIREAIAASKQALGTLKGTDTKGRLEVLEDAEKELQGR